MSGTVRKSLIGRELDPDRFAVARMIDASSSFEIVSNRCLIKNSSTKFRIQAYSLLPWQLTPGEFQMFLSPEPDLGYEGPGQISCRGP